MKRSEAAKSSLKKGFSCSQAVLSAFCGDFDLDHSKALKLAAGFGGGMGRMALTCGAVTGAFMVLGLKHGGTVAEDLEAKERTRQSVVEFVQRFKSLNGSITCKDLLRCDLSTSEGYDHAKKSGLIRILCPKFVGDAAEILEEILSAR